MTPALLFWFLVCLLLVCSSAEEEIQGKGVYVNKKEGLLEKKVPADEAASDYLGDYIMYNLLQQSGLGDYSFLEPSSIQLGLCEAADRDCKRNFLYYKRPLYPGKDIDDCGLFGCGGVKAITTTKAHIEQFALIALVDMMVMNSDRFTIPRVCGGNKNNILWHKVKPDVRNSVLLPIDNGWGAIFLMLSHNLKGKSSRTIETYFNEYIQKFRRVVKIIAYAGGQDRREMIKQLAQDIWKKNKNIFRGRKMEIKKDEIIPAIVNFWMQNRWSVAEKIKQMTEQQLKDVVNPQRTLRGSVAPIQKKEEERQFGFMQKAVGNNIDIILNSPRHAAAHVEEREVMYYDEELEDEIEWLYHMKSKQLERALRKAWRKAKE